MTIVSPVPLPDLAALAAGAGLRSAAVWGALKRQRALGPSFVARDAGGAPLAAGFLVPFGDGSTAEAAFLVAPPARGRLRGLVAAIRLTLAASPYAAIVTVCRSRAGARLARLSGFAPAAEAEGREIWLWERSRSS